MPSPKRVDPFATPTWTGTPRRTLRWKVSRAPKRSKENPTWWNARAIARRRKQRGHVHNVIQSQQLEAKAAQFRKAKEARTNG